MSAGYRIWIGNMTRDVTIEDFTAAFSRFGLFAEGVRMRTNLAHPLGAEAVITFITQQDAALALGLDGTHIVDVDKCVYVTWYEQREPWSVFTEDY